MYDGSILRSLAELQPSYFVAYLSPQTRRGSHHDEERPISAGYLQAGVFGLAVCFPDLTDAPRSLLGLDGFAFLGQIAVAVPVHVENVAVEHQPEAGLGFRPEHEQAILRLGLVGGFPADGAVDLGQVGAWDGGRPEESSQKRKSQRGGFHGSAPIGNQRERCLANSSSITASSVSRSCKPVKTCWPITNVGTPVTPASS